LTHIIVGMNKLKLNKYKYPLTYIDIREFETLSAHADNKSNSLVFHRNQSL